VLSGGGARGAYEAGLVVGLFARGEDFEIITGTSIGAINAAFIAQGRLDALEQLWHTIASRRIIRYLPRIAAGVDLLKRLSERRTLLERVESLPPVIADVAAMWPLQRLLGLLGGLSELPIAQLLQEQLAFARLARTLVVPATNLSKTRLDAFAYFADDARWAAFAAARPSAYRIVDDRVLALCVQASAAIPGAFAPVVFAPPGETLPLAYVDGGVTNNTPIGLAIDAGARAITVVMLEPPATADAQYPMENLVQVGMGSFMAIQQRFLELDLKTVGYVNASIAGGTADKIPVTVRTFRPRATIALNVLAFDDQPAIDAAYGAGYADGFGETAKVA